MSSSDTHGSIVAHVLVVGFHAQLGNRIEFAYPRLHGTPILRSPKISDTSDISADAVSPTLARHNPNTPNMFVTPEKSIQPPPSNTGNWGVLPDEWSFLPFMALPDGVHDHHHDIVFFTLPPDVHCVSCFRQVHASDAKTHSAVSTLSYDQGVAARGSVQKSVVLLCRRPLYGLLADRLIPAVRAYFDQADFAHTTVLSSLFHSLNVSLTRPMLNHVDTLFHGLDLRTVLRRLGPQTLALVKLILLERRIIVYSQPVHQACNAVIALASLFKGALDTIAPSVTPLDTSEDSPSLGLPLALFSQHDRIILQPYAPLPLVTQLIPNNSPRACLMGTSHNVGVLLSTTAAAAARKAAAAKKALTPLARARGYFQQSVSAAEVTPRERHPVPVSSKSSATVSSSIQSDPFKTPERSASPERGSGTVPIVDALVNLSTGKISVSGAIEPLCRITRQERRFMRDLVASAGTSSASVSSSGATGSFLGSDDYIRSRLREYISGFLRSVSSVDSVLGGPIGGETWSAEMVDNFNFSKFEAYNENFVTTWMTTRNAAQWARKCKIKSSSVIPPPEPELDESLVEESFIPADRVAEGLSGLRQNVANLGRLSNLVSSRAAEGISNLFKRIEQEVVKMDTAVVVANNSNQSSPRTPASQVQSKKNFDQPESKLTLSVSSPQ